MVDLAVIQIRGTINVPEKIKDTLKHLKLKRVNNCRIIADSVYVRGALEKAKHLLTWGFIDSETLKLLKKKDKESNVFCLSPPVKGYGRKGVKFPFSRGGAYGDRSDKINDLIKRML
jgi:large subunit ribosomal protein L30